MYVTVIMFNSKRISYRTEGKMKNLNTICLLPLSLIQVLTAALIPHTDTNNRTHLSLLRWIFSLLSCPRSDSTVSFTTTAMTTYTALIASASSRISARRVFARTATEEMMRLVSDELLKRLKRNVYL